MYVESQKSRRDPASSILSSVSFLGNTGSSFGFRSQSIKGLRWRCRRGLRAGVELAKACLRRQDRAEWASNMARDDRGGMKLKRVRKMGWDGDSWMQSKKSESGSGRGRVE